MAVEEREDKKMGDRVTSYADKYEQALKGNIKNFLRVAKECFQRGIFSKERIISDAKAHGAVITDKDLGVEEVTEEKTEEKKEEPKKSKGDKRKLKGVKKHPGLFTAIKGTLRRILNRIMHGKGQTSYEHYQADAVRQVEEEYDGELSEGPDPKNVTRRVIEEAADEIVAEGEVEEKTEEEKTEEEKTEEEKTEEEKSEEEKSEEEKTEEEKTEEEKTEEEKTEEEKTEEEKTEEEKTEEEKTEEEKTEEEKSEEEKTEEEKTGATLELEEDEDLLDFEPEEDEKPVAKKKTFMERAEARADKYEAAIDRTGEKIVRKVADAKEATVDTAAKIAGATVAVGRIGKKIAIKGATTISGKLTKVAGSIAKAAKKGKDNVVEATLEGASVVAGAAMTVGRLGKRTIRGVKSFGKHKSFKDRSGSLRRLSKKEEVEEEQTFEEELEFTDEDLPDEVLSAMTEEKKEEELSESEKKAAERIESRGSLTAKGLVEGQEAFTSAVKSVLEKSAISEQEKQEQQKEQEQLQTHTRQQEDELTQ